MDRKLWYVVAYQKPYIDLINMILLKDIYQKQSCRCITEYLEKLFSDVDRKNSGL